MSSGVHTRVWENAQCHGTTLLFLLALADEANDNGDADADVVTLAKKARTTDRHVRRLVDAVDAMKGCSAVLTGGHVRASLTPYAVARVPAPMIVLEAEPTPTDGLSSADEMSVADEMSGRNVRGGRNVRAAQPENPPPTRDVFIPPPVRKETIPATSSVAGGFRAKTLAHISASLGGLRVEKAGGNALAWAGQIVGLLGGWSDDDDAAAAVIWDAFRASERWRFKGAKPADWPIAMGDWYANEYRPTVRRAIILGER